ncbi:four-carbon acid sugar kinase family protein [Wenxinia saemankumensis]|uniref:Uncharacterized protein n=1 Tax=Wenxinia saemankumensis TaxID=1447782 RepID=A0A1M6I1N4_9RHOB|nr:four-carbon acid sugar kinase family protein [Wenxinia saemankumensis]SHJ28338.1 hypothetical protein SAMN05444417_3469 [Wenxinia saemankumensis]
MSSDHDTPGLGDLSAKTESDLRDLIAAVERHWDKIGWPTEVVNVDLSSMSGEEVLERMEAVLRERGIKVLSVDLIRADRDRDGPLELGVIARVLALASPGS